MKLDRFSRDPQKFRSTDVLHQVDEGERSLDLTQVRQALIQQKERSQQRLEEVMSWEHRPYRTFQDSDFMRYCDAIFALRVLFPDESELGRMDPRLQSEFIIPSKDAAPTRDQLRKVYSDEYASLILLNAPNGFKEVSKQVRFSFLENPPTMVEFLSAFANARKNNYFGKMAEIGLVLSRLYPETIDQVKSALRATFPKLTDYSWVHNAYAIALAILVDPELRALVDTTTADYLAEKKKELKRTAQGNLACLKIIEADYAGFDENQDLVVQFTGHKQARQTSKLPERFVA